MATRIAAVSRAVAEEAVRWFGVSRARIEIVPNGVDEFFSPDGDEDDYILFVGTIEPRKGLDDLLGGLGVAAACRGRGCAVRRRGMGRRAAAARAPR